MELKHIETFENEYNEANYSHTYGEYYASKPITICVEIDGVRLDAQTPDTPGRNTSSTITFNDSIEINSSFSKLTDEQQEAVTVFCQKIYDEYDYDVDAFCNAWEKAINSDEYFGQGNPVDARFFEE